jgi:hypothetical protein
MGAEIYQGATNTYLDDCAADACRRFVYDGAGALMALLDYSANTQRWECAGGPSDFDPTEATSFPTFDGRKYQAYRDMCAAMTADGGAGAPDGSD